MKKIFTQKNRGYTIIETMIAISLFIVITTVGMTSLLNANLVYRKSQNMRSIIDNLNYVMEDMSKNMRTGSKFRCFRSGDSLNTTEAGGVSRSCPNGWALAFESPLGSASTSSDQWVYYLRLDTNVTPNVTRIYKSTNSMTDFFQVTSSEIEIDSDASSFSVLGAEPVSALDTQQPLITIRLVGNIRYKTVDTPFSLQTSVSSRYVDIGN